MTQRAMAWLLGMSQSMYSQWLTAQRELGKEALLGIKNIYPDLVSPELVETARTRGRPQGEENDSNTRP